MSNRLHRLIEWPLWSWKHLTISVVVLLAALALVGKATNALSAKENPTSVAVPVATSTPPREQAPTSPSATTTTAPVPQVSDSSTYAAAVGAPCQRIAASFMNAWVRSSLPTADWLSGMRPYASSALMTQLQGTDPARVPASRVSGRPTAVRSGSGVEVLRFATDGGRVDVVTQKRGSWCVVRDIEPAGDVQGAPTPTLTASVAGG